MEIPLQGGIANSGSVVRVGETVRRPFNAVTQPLLEHLDSVDFPAPRWLGIDEQRRDILSYIHGVVPIPPFPTWILEPDPIASVATLMRKYHSSTHGLSLNAEWAPELADPHGGPVICHNDVCPENVVFSDDEAIAFLDFDFAAPGRPIWDIAMCTRMWILGLSFPNDTYELPSREAFCEVRLPLFRVFVDAYGLPVDEREGLVDAIIESRRIGGSFVAQRAQAGHARFIEMWNERGGLAGDERILNWYIDKRDLMLAALV